MREIKFRAWSNAFETMFYSEEQSDDILFSMDESGICVCTLEDSWSCGSGEWVNREEWREAKDAVLMQYTGLKDKNGVEIYEGDIVDCYDEEEISFMRVRTQSLKGVVNFDSGSFGVEGNHLALICASTVEVVGNIHENGELLNES